MVAVAVLARRRRPILAADDVFGLYRVQRADDLQLFIAHSIGVKVIGRLHRDQAQKLHQVVLHHIAHGTRSIVIGAAPGHIDCLSHRDLHMVDVFRLPQRLEQDIGKAHRHQVLDGFLAQIMVDPVDLLFREMPRQNRVQRPRRGQIAAKGLFHHDARLSIGNAMGMQPLSQITKERGRD